MEANVAQDMQKELDAIREAGTYKEERIIVSPQSADIRVRDGSEVLNFCANNYLGLADDPQLINAAKEALDQYGFGMSSVRFICGTLDIHKQLEDRITKFLGTDDTILYTSCFDANGGLFETILGKQDAVVSDALNHASIIDGIRLCKAMRYRFAHDDMDDLKEKLAEAREAGARRILVATDGVFSMDGDIARLDEICDIADDFDAMVMVDDSHATGFVGPTGRGSIEHCGVMGRIDVITSTLGKALGGASGGFTSGRAEIVDLLRQRSRPYLFSNTVAPAIVGASLAAFERISGSTALRDTLEENTRYFREQMTSAGFAIRPGVHAIVPIMLGEAALAVRMADALLERGIYVIGFSYPVVPKGQARIRVQISAAHTREHLDRAIIAFTEVGKELGVIGMIALAGLWLAQAAEVRRVDYSPADIRVLGGVRAGDFEPSPIPALDVRIRARLGAVTVLEMYGSTGLVAHADPTTLGESGGFELLFGRAWSPDPAVQRFLGGGIGVGAYRVLFEQSPDLAPVATFAIVYRTHARWTLSEFAGRAFVGDRTEGVQGSTTFGVHLKHGWHAAISARARLGEEGTSIVEGNVGVLFRPRRLGPPIR